MNENKKNQRQQDINKGKRRESGEWMEDPRENQPNQGPDSERDVADDTGEQGASNKPKMDPDLPADLGGDSEDETLNIPPGTGVKRGGQRRDN